MAKAYLKPKNVSQRLPKPALSPAPHCHAIPPKLVYAPEVELKERLGM